MCFSHFFKTTLAICEGFRCNFWKFHVSAIPEFHLVGESNAAPRHRGTEAKGRDSTCQGYFEMPTLTNMPTKNQNIELGVRWNMLKHDR